MSQTTPEYQYFLKDHLGNTRVAFYDEGEILQMNDCYTFGMEFTGRLGGNIKYRYNAKEMQDDAIGGVGLDCYDYGAKFYEPGIGRFHTQDAFAEKYLDFTLYQYGANNPIKFIDINGDSIWVYYFEDNKLYWLLYQNNQLIDVANGDITYDGDNGFALRALDALNELSKTEIGQLKLAELSESKYNFNIKESPNRNSFDPDNKNFKEEGGLGGGTIWWNSTGEKAYPIPTEQGLLIDPTISLSHELIGHGIQANRGEISDKMWRGLKIREWEAMSTENQIRFELGKPLRNRYSIYGTEANYKSGYFDPLLKIRGTSLIVDKYLFRKLNKSRVLNRN